MSAAQDILRTYRAPRAVIRRRAAPPEREARAFVVLLVGCLLMFAAQWPGLARAAHEDPSVPLDARIGGALFGWMFLMPLVLYLVAAVSHLLARALGGRGTWYGARVALFWAVLASAPLWLLAGLVLGFIGAGPVQTACALVASAVFVAFWILGLLEVETGDAEAVA